MSVLLSSGSNAHGQLSNGTLEDSHEFFPCIFSGCLPGSTPPNTHQVLHVASGANHTLALLEMRDSNGGLYTELWGCGDGSSGQLGADYLRDSQQGRSTSVFRAISLPLATRGLDGYHYNCVAASWETTYIVLSCPGKTDILVSMGSNDFGDLGVGVGKGKETSKPFHVISFEHLTVHDIDTSNISVQSLATGQHHITVHIQVALKDGSSTTLVVGWGTSRHGQLGHVTPKGGRAPPFLSIPTIISLDPSLGPSVAASLGSQHTAFLHASGQLSSLGSNRKGQLLEPGNDVRGVISMACTWNGTYVLVRGEDGDTQILATGSHAHGQLGRQLSEDSPTSSQLTRVEFPSKAHRIDAMACGTEHVLALCSARDRVGSSSTSIWGWGWNEHGNLGTGKTEDVHIPVQVWLASPNIEITIRAKEAKGIWAGCGTSWIFYTTS